MFRFDPDVRVYVHREAIDFRLHINGLAAMVEQTLKLDPFGRAVYVFRNRRADRVKILLWDRNGFWLMMKRLETDRFVWPRPRDMVMELSVEQLQWLLAGIDLNAMRGHSFLHYRHAS
jgi:transposase